MALHLREQILAAIKTNLTGLATTGSQVYRGRTYPQEADNLPGLLIYQGPDQANAGDDDGEIYDYIDSTLTVIVEAWAQATSDPLETTLNQINKEVVIALQADRTQGVSEVIDLEEGDVSEPELSGEGNKRTARIAMEFFIKYRRTRTDPSQ